LSSSASVEMATAMALLAHGDAQLTLEELATLCKQAENEYVGANSGIMDQFVVAGAVADRAMLLDCKSLEFELLPLPSEIRVVICNSMVKHTVATGWYGDRRDEVEAGQSVLRERLGIALLRDATVADLEACAGKMNAKSWKRCRHIITENARVEESKTALIRRDVVRFGEIMLAAHASMLDDFEASCAEVDALVEIAMLQAGLLWGAEYRRRVWGMHGEPGTGGCY
jgi:galactokinase